MNRQVRLVPLVLSALVLLALTAAACESSAGTAQVKSAILGKGVDQNGNMVDPTDTFAPTDPTIHVVATLANVPDGTTLKAMWYVVEVQGSEPGVIDEISRTLGSGEETVDFTLANDRPWPVGKYKVELYLNDTLDKTLEFEVKE